MPSFFIASFLRQLSLCVLIISFNFQAETIVKIFKAAAQHPSPSSAWILQSAAATGKNVTLISRWSQRNLERGKMVKFQQTHFIDSRTSKVTDMLPVDVSNE